MFEDSPIDRLREIGKEIFALCDEHKIPFVFLFMEEANKQAASAHMEAYAQVTPAQADAMFARFLAEDMVRRQVSNPN